MTTVTDWLQEGPAWIAYSTRVVKRIPSRWVTFLASRILART
jgi:hypothetical protein